MLTSTTSSTPVTSSTSNANSNEGLTGSQIGGIIGGVIGAVFILALTALILFFRQRRQKRLPETAAPPSPKPDVENDADKRDTATITTSATGAEEDKNLHMLGGHMRQEMDAQGGCVRHEMEGVNRGYAAGGYIPVDEKELLKRGGVPELEGNIGAVAELDGGSITPSGNADVKI
ncbi:uncharacterized protein ATNIH1004_003828 [Aspergillus tanneri]|uniref:Uncharacterized protein n=1 Tax=Aspergillus tanneri TaxID=1220188 RepID=A0A5M9MPX5_9EURO|nr:uncharacterized protein ATNIH1004_003828 [Aspergillus tanneri]KAA8647946.1 hypothetical protein ATNIH1004_003828 [Aspergillus tanneri]